MQEPSSRAVQQEAAGLRLRERRGGAGLPGPRQPADLRRHQGT